MKSPSEPGTGLVVLGDEHLPPDVLREEMERLSGAAVEFAKASIRTNTQVNYERIWERFVFWCTRRGLDPLPAPPGVLAAYLTAAASEGIATVPKPDRPSRPGKPLNARSLWVHLSAVIFFHTKSGHPNPMAEVPRDLLDGILSTTATPPRKKRWISQRQLNTVVGGFPHSLRGLRDRALLLVAFASGGRRRSEIASMQVEDLRDEELGITWTIPRTKISNDPLQVGIPLLRGSPTTCPARSLRAWMGAAGIKHGPVFRRIDRFGTLGKTSIRPAVVADIVKQAAERLGLDPREFGGHSLRSGFATDMARKGQRVEGIMAAGGWKSYATVQGYIRTGEQLAADNPVRLALEEDL